MQYFEHTLQFQYVQHTLKEIHIRSCLNIFLAGRQPVVRKLIGRPLKTGYLKKKIGWLGKFTEKRSRIE